MSDETFDFVIIGSGFGGSVSAMRLVEKGYSVLVLEQGRRYRDRPIPKAPKAQDHTGREQPAANTPMALAQTGREHSFPKTNWMFWKYLWAPALRCFGILQISPFRDMFVMHGVGVGGGSLGYANVLVQPTDKLFENPAWKHLADWKSILTPHYQTARRMLGAAPNPCLWESDKVLKEIAAELGVERTFQAVEVSVFFGENGREGQEVPDPYFGGEGPPRRACIHCGACMIGCRYNAKNTLDKNYLFFAEKWGAQVRAESEVCDVRPLSEGQPDGARYEVVYRRTTAWGYKPRRSVRTRNVVVSAGTLGTLHLLFRCRDVTRSLPRISQRLGDTVRTNSEALLGAVSRDLNMDYSKGIAITSIFQPDAVTAMEPVRYPAGSSLMRFLSSPLVEPGSSIPRRLFRTASMILRYPVDFLRLYVLPGWAQRTTILLVMQTENNQTRMRLGRHLFTLFRQRLVTRSSGESNIPGSIEIGHGVTRRFADKVNATPAGTINEGLLNIPMTAHVLGGCPFGRDDQEGVIGLNFQVHNYPGLYIVDGSIVPANPGVNPTLTITALAEYAMSCVPPKDGEVRGEPLWVTRVES